MAVTIYFKGLWQDYVQFFCQTKNNSIDRMIKVKEMVTNKPNLKIFFSCTAQDYNQAISPAVLVFYGDKISPLGDVLIPLHYRIV